MTTRIKLDHRVTTERCSGSGHDGAMLPNMEGKPQLRTPYFYVRMQGYAEHIQFKLHITSQDSRAGTAPFGSGALRVLGPLGPVPFGYDESTVASLALSEFPQDSRVCIAAFGSGSSGSRPSAGPLHSD